ncbi:hypothetical protein J437_LFUL009439 [Ladona fulva]|uniref:Uncharacterized protein n=1 Tax=Ladona fulva TaxID=123851 RepID=A0A8K0JXT4_LADFU|nr:hypothetical protein J437_LFUL009439 [Ladona fulva]
MALSVFAASVARFVPFWNIPLLTAGGFTYDFTNPKTDPDSEYYMLTRLGMSFRDIAFTIMATTDKSKKAEIGAKSSQSIQELAPQM